MSRATSSRSTSLDRAHLDPAELRAALALRDLTDPRQGAHAIQLVIADVVAAVAAVDDPTVLERRDHPVVALADNYDHLGYPPGAVTRDARYTRYVDAGHVLRSHTSAQIPPALRELAGSTESDVLLVSPGICYRRDSIDRLHTGAPHQLDLWRLSAGTALAEDALVELVALVVAAALPGARWRHVPSTHPYTTAGRQVDVWWRDQWVEVAECGLAAETVLARAGLGPEWSGLALGTGLDRLVMLRKGLPDIRLLRSRDPRVADQMLDLSPYRPVSAMPPVRRDLSVAVGPDVDASDEVVGDRVRAALGSDADSVETVAVVSETARDDLPLPAQRRLGILPGQRNLLVRLMIRPLDRTLTDAEANRLRDRVYAELHEGSRGEWTTG